MTFRNLTSALLPSLVALLTIGCASDVTEPTSEPELDEPVEEVEEMATEEQEALLFRITDAQSDEPVDGVTVCVDGDETRCALTSAWGWIELRVGACERITLVTDATERYRSHLLYVGANRSGNAFDLPLISEKALSEAVDEHVELETASFVLGIARTGNFQGPASGIAPELLEAEAHQLHYVDADGALSEALGATGERGLYLYSDVVAATQPTVGLVNDVAGINTALVAANGCVPAASEDGIADALAPLREGAVTIAPTLFCE